MDEETIQESTSQAKSLTDEEKLRLKAQDARLVSEHKAISLEVEAKKHWDLFYKRNETRFFKDRHWSTREFEELLGGGTDQRRTIFEVGCGVGNFIFPLVEEGLEFDIIACDLSPRAVEMVKNHPSYSPSMLVFPCDVTTRELFDYVPEGTVDVVTLIFVLSAVHPEKFGVVLRNAAKALKPGGTVLFRDYGLHDMAQIRFKAGHKIAENWYMRQDGTRSYYFSKEFAEEIFKDAGFKVEENIYVHRRTINKKENIDVPRIFVQIKAKKLGW